MHVPLPPNAVRDAMPVFFEMLEANDDSAARVVLFGGVALLFTVAVLVIVLKAADMRVGSELEWTGWLLIPVCAALFVAHVQLEPRVGRGRVVGDDRGAKGLRAARPTASVMV